MRFALTCALALGLLIAAPLAHAGDCDDDPTIMPYLRALKTDSKNQDNLYNLAIAYYKKVVTVDPGQPNPCLPDGINAMKRFIKAASGSSQNKALADAWGVLGILQFQFGDDAEAGLDSFLHAIKLRSDDKESTFGAALASMKLGKTQEASELFKKTILLDPNNVTAHYNYATSLLTIYGEKPTPEQNESLKRAFEGAAKAGERSKKSSKDILLVTYNRLGDLYGRSNEVPKAIVVLNKAVELDDTDYNAHFQLGLLYNKDKNFLKMVDEYEKAVKIQPTQEDAHYNLAVAYVNQERFADAYEQFAYITDNINKGNSEVLALQAQTLERAITELTAAGTTAFTAEDYFTAKQKFEEVLKLNPKDKSADKYLDEANKQIEAKFAEYVKAGDKKAKSGSKTDAAEFYEKALTLKPDAADVKAKRDKLGADISQLVNRYISKGDSAFAKNDFFTAEESYRKASKFKQGKVKAEARLKKLGDKFKGDFARKMKSGQDALKSGSLGAARNAFKGALALKPGDKEANAGLVQANTRMSEQIKKLTAQADEAAGAGKKAEAAKAYNKILALDPSNKNAAEQVKSLTGNVAKAVVNADQVKALYYQGVDFYVNNNIKQAIATWEKLLAIDPNHDDARKNIARAKTKLDALAKLKG